MQATCNCPVWQAYHTRPGSKMSMDPGVVYFVHLCVRACDAMADPMYITSMSSLLGAHRHHKPIIITTTTAAAV
jgi:hypothetical protein